MKVTPLLELRGFRSSFDDLVTFNSRSRYLILIYISMSRSSTTWTLILPLDTSEHNSIAATASSSGNVCVINLSRFRIPPLRAEIPAGQVSQYRFINFKFICVVISFTFEVHTYWCNIPLISWYAWTVNCSWCLYQLRWPSLLHQLVLYMQPLQR